MSKNKHTFILRLRQVRHPVFVRRLISYRPESRPMVSNSRVLRLDYSESWCHCVGTFLCLPPLKAMRGSWAMPGASAKRIALGSGSPYMWDGWTP